ncbi:acyltransferase [Leptotrichia sp. oral taxon 847]|uniref:acyltransferase n=1 Tax=Leptotrichia sp. oral taxon 847 TaxID=1785996 RepID=UPI00076832AF|nr:acyltransferase family protein [Leptotrichia sp. oral taxon 847]AMD94525.1 hypothetical protein AXF11_02215 [Leptotrichia sp. oral taxon 847]
MNQDEKLFFRFDVLKFVAIIMVIFIHIVCRKLYEIENGISYEWIVSNVIDSFCRSCVPIFVMVSGFFLLGKDEEITFFFKKRFLKIIPKFLIYSVIFYLFTIIFQSNNFKSALFFKKSFYVNFVKQLLNGKIYYHLWYVYMIISIYLVTPILRKIILWDKEKKFKNTKYLIFIWGFFWIFIPFLDTFLKLNTNAYNQIGQYIGYFLLGYLIGNKKIEIFKNKKVNMILFFIFNFLIIYFTYIFSKKDSKLFDHFYNYHSIFVFVVSVMLFEFIINFEVKKKPKNKNLKLKKFVKAVSTATFDIYLMHPIFVYFCENYFKNKMGYGKYIAVSFFIVFLGAFFVSLIFYYVKKLLERSIKWQ